MAKRAELRGKKRGFLEASWKTKTEIIPDDCLMPEQVGAYGTLRRENINI